MSAERKQRRPQFTSYVDVEVDIDPEDLEAAGWVYVGDEAKPKDGFAPRRIVTDTEAVDLVHRWHDETHPMPWVWCDESPCKEVRP